MGFLQWALLTVQYSENASSNKIREGRSARTRHLAFLPCFCPQRFVSEVDTFHFPLRSGASTMAPEKPSTSLVTLSGDWICTGLPLLFTATHCLKEQFHPRHTRKLSLHFLLKQREMLKIATQFSRRFVFFVFSPPLE